MAQFALVVDDLRQLQLPTGYEVVHARTVVDAAVVLASRPVDVLLLDHDLGGEATVKPLISFIVSRDVQGKPLRIGAIYIISSNPAAHDDFPRALRRRGYHVKLGLGPAAIDHRATVARNDIAQEIDLAHRPYA